MAYINVEEGVPGVRSLALFRPETGKPLYELVQILLRGESSLSPAERELIAAYVSSGNDCNFCMKSHAAAARSFYGDEEYKVDEVLNDIDDAQISEKMKTLLRIAGKVRADGRQVSEEDILEARAQGISDMGIHDTVLIAATFSMFNRYVDGLATWTPEDPAAYVAMGKRMAEHGYVLPQKKS
jgi:uncharacterized peroxidase-related enzyme